MKRFCLGWVLISIFGIGIAWAIPTSDIEYMRDKLREKFPGAQSITINDLVGKLKSDSPPILIDTRAKEEFDISHLKGAILFEPEKDSIDALLTKLSGHKEVITYCSVGYRSSMIAEQLMNNGVQNVRSLDGGIFEWANSGHPVFSGNGTTEDIVKYVHPFDKKWGKFLNPELHPPDY